MPTDVARNVKIATTTGVAGLSIEDSSGDEAEPLFDFTLAVERISAARRAVDESGTGILLTARSEGFIVGRPSRRDDQTAHRVRRSGRGLLVCAGAVDDAGCVGGGESGGAQAGQRPRGQRLHDGGGTCRARCAKNQRRRRFGPHRVGSFLYAASEIAEHGTFARLAAGIPFPVLNRRFTLAAELWLVVSG